MPKPYASPKILNAPRPPSLRRWIHQVDRRLVRVYGDPKLRGGDPVAALVGCILSQATTDAQSGAAYDALLRAFPTWAQIRDARESQIARVIKQSGLANEKASYIKGTLQFIERERGTITLSFLRRMSTQDARHWLMQIRGVGPKTASIVLLFALKQDAFPVDTHIYRVSKRLGWIDTHVTANQAHDLLGVAIAPARKYPLHLNLIRHGREICTARVPHCEICPLTDLCEYYSRHAKNI